jgi:hypothetical protein
MVFFLVFFLSKFLLHTRRSLRRRRRARGRRSWRWRRRQRSAVVGPRVAQRQARRDGRGRRRRKEPSGSRPRRNLRSTLSAHARLVEGRDRPQGELWPGGSGADRGRGLYSCKNPVDPQRLKARGFKPLKLKCDLLVSPSLCVQAFAFKPVRCAAYIEVGLCRLNQVDP